MPRAAAMVGGKCAQLRIVTRGWRDQRFDFKRSIWQRERGLRCAGAGHNRLQFDIERLPRFERNDALAGAVRLVKARAVVEVGKAIEAERNMEPGPRIRAIDHTGLQRQQDFSRRRRLRMAPSRR